MRNSVANIAKFYATPLGQAAATHIGDRLAQAWGAGPNAAMGRVAGFGYTDPFLSLFPEAERLIPLTPQVPKSEMSNVPAGTCVTADYAWPLPDASVDRLLVVHGLEETEAPRRLMREIWRVLSDDGRVIIVVPNRRGPWTMAEKTPFAQGRPYLRGQLNALLREAMFTPAAWSSALYFPPVNRRFVLKSSKAWERAGHQLWSALAGVIFVEARKELALPVSGSKVEILRPRLIQKAGQRLVGGSSGYGDQEKINRLRSK